MRRRVLPLAEMRAPFTVAREELRAGDRGAEDVDFDALDAAARSLAVAENMAIFHGWPEAGVQGITEASPHSELTRSEDFNEYPALRSCGGRAAPAERSGRPYGLALGTDDYTSVVETPSTAGTCFSTTCARSSVGRSSGRPVCVARSCSANEAAISCSSPARTSPSGTTTTARRGASLP